MTQKQLAEILAVFGKLKIENNSFFKRWEKEIYKFIIDEVKKMVR